MRYKERFGDNYKDVEDHEVYTVGGDEGVFAVWKEHAPYDYNGKHYDRYLVHFLGGDDGNWWEIACYDSSWIPGINKVLEKM